MLTPLTLSRWRHFKRVSVFKMAGYARPAGYESEDSDDDFAFFTPDSNQEKDYSNDPKPPVAETARRIGVNKSNATQSNKRRASSEESQMLENYRLAAMKGQIDTIKEVVQSGVDIDHVLKCNWTALMYACSSGHVDIVTYLLESGADANFNKEFFTPLMALCSSKCESEDDLVSCALSLAKHGAKVNCSEKHLVTPLMFATRGGRKNVVKALLEVGADIDAQDNRGWTALSWAAHNGQKEMVQLLLESKADATKACPNGDVASDLASAKGYTEIATLLIDACSINKSQVSQTSPTVPKVSLTNGTAPRDPRTTSQPLPSKTSSSCVLRESTKNYTRYGELELFLAGLELSHLTTLFQENNFDFQAFLSITDTELEKIGITSVGYRKKILDAICEVHKKDWEKTSLPSVQKKKNISCPEVKAVVENITAHIGYIQATISYLSKEVCIRPENLELGKEAVSVLALSEQTSAALTSTKNLEEELLRLKLNLDKLGHYFSSFAN